MAKEVRRLQATPVSLHSNFFTHFFTYAPEEEFGNG
jgi:hypothetical protein